MHPIKARLPECGLTSWAGLHGSSFALAIANAAAAAPGVTLVLARSGRQALLLERDLQQFMAPEQPLLHFPDWETLPYDLYSPHPDIISRRLATLADLPALDHGIVLLPVSTLMQRLAPLEFVLGRSISLHLGQRLNLGTFRETLVKAGYESSEQVIQAGQFAVRGGVLDLFAMGGEEPYRIEMLDENIESIRSFDIDSQRSKEQIKSIRLLPAREYPFDSDSIEKFRESYRLQFDIDTRNSPLYQDLRQGLHPQGLEYYLPLFFERTTSLLNYLRSAPKFIVQDGVSEAAERFYQQVEERYEQRRHDIERPVLEPEQLYFSWRVIISELDGVQGVSLDPAVGKPDSSVSFQTAPAPQVPLHEKSAQPAAALNNHIETSNQQILIAADSPGRREVLLDTLRAFDLQPDRLDGWAAFMESKSQLNIAVLPLDNGFAITADPGMAVITESELFGGRIRLREPGRVRERDPDAIIRDLADLHAGAPVVHLDHGVGRYQGLNVLQIDSQDQEFLTLEYAGGDRLYVPVASLHLVSRYTGSSPETAPLHKLGGEQWDKVKKRAAGRIRDVAAELLDLYARRQARTGHAYPVDLQLYTEFAATFEFEETTDQQTTIDAVLADMQSEQPMDRVICGDVGFGKTEVALRAAFIAAHAGKQTAILVPTTLLAQQHYSTFSDRFADWPVRVEVLSRFRTGKQSAAILAGLEDGRVDIVIGTHRLIQADVKFKDLGLVIIDEEQRFGVRQKERFKALRNEVDMLTLTATPIPRTLNMALSGLRELSIIATPPARRMAIKTFICPWDRSLIREAIQRELQRGGQVYFLHNEVRTIETAARELQEIMPVARVRIAHGQMHSRELESVMRDFYRQKFNVLVCSTIIENGIDVPSANTIIINRADKFGLAQLHQLRGRVGRSHHRAYAYLLIPDRRSITSDARKRLEAIQSLEELGAGFSLATHDMEIRGAGELLGAEQSGQIHEIGFSLYMDLLERAVAALKAGREPELDGPLTLSSDIELQIPALIPEDYLPDVYTRLMLYKRISGAANSNRLRELQVEMIDRFGLLPAAVKSLFELARLRIAARRLGISKIALGEEGGRVEFLPDAKVEPEALIKLIQSEPASYRLDGPEKLRISANLENAGQRIAFVQRLLAQLKSPS